MSNATSDSDDFESFVADARALWCSVTAPRAERPWGNGSDALTVLEMCTQAQQHGRRVMPRQRVAAGTNAIRHHTFAEPFQGPTGERS